MYIINCRIRGGRAVKGFRKCGHDEHRIIDMIGPPQLFCGVYILGDLQKEELLQRLIGEICLILAKSRVRREVGIVIEENQMLSPPVKHSRAKWLMTV